MTDSEILEAVDYLRSTMIAVATGGPLINDVNDQFQKTYTLVDEELACRGIKNPLPYKNLWDWYGRWSSGDMPTYQSRRVFVSEIFNPLISRISTGQVEEFEPTGWALVDRTVGELRDRFASATNAEQFQALGLLCREALISLAQAVYIPERHPTLDGVAPSQTDAKRMLEAYIAVELGGRANAEARKHARLALDLAVSLQHKRTAGFRDAALCVEATTSLINIIAIVSGRRDPVGLLT
jgi:hypothetical protein